jgi:hypothetical protein
MIITICLQNSDGKDIISVPNQCFVDLEAALTIVTTESLRNLYQKKCVCVCSILKRQVNM